MDRRRARSSRCGRFRPDGRPIAERPAALDYGKRRVNLSKAAEWASVGGWRPWEHGWVAVREAAHLLGVSGQRVFMERVLAEAGLRPNIAMRLASTDDVRRLLEIGLGIGSVARISAEREIAAGHLRALNTAAHFARAATAALD